MTKHPTTKAPQFMGYLRTIARASRNFEGAAWASYDEAFRRQAANRNSLDWGMIDLTIYNEAFIGTAKLMPQCRYSLADTQETRECQFAPGMTRPRRTSLAQRHGGAHHAHGLIEGEQDNPLRYATCTVETRHCLQGTVCGCAVGSSVV